MQRLLWIVKRAPFSSRRARLRAFWHYIIRNYHYEICIRCGRPVGPHTGSWWYSTTVLWDKVIGDSTTIVCPPCFTEAANAKDLAICWRATHDIGQSYREPEKEER